jgi:hypothetical protein
VFALTTFIERWHTLGSHVRGPNKTNVYEYNIQMREVFKRRLPTEDASTKYKFCISLEMCTYDVPLLQKEIYKALGTEPSLRDIWVPRITKVLQNYIINYDMEELTDVYRFQFYVHHMPFLEIVNTRNKDTSGQPPYRYYFPIQK